MDALQEALQEAGSGPSCPEVPQRCGRGIAILKVLLAEDERFQREAFAALFEAANRRLTDQRIQFELTQVASAHAVLEMLAETTDWQLVLLDVFMPDLCGTEIIQAAWSPRPNPRRNERCPALTPTLTQVFVAISIVDLDRPIK